VASKVDVGAGAGAPRPKSSGGAGEAPVTGARRGGLFGFIGESIAELKKVEWPGQNQVIQGTVVVLIACIIVGTYLWVNDQVWQEFVKKVLL
jgi:preprotein translocase subunit SecE